MARKFSAFELKIWCSLKKLHWQCLGFKIFLAWAWILGYFPWIFYSSQASNILKLTLGFASLGLLAQSCAKKSLNKIQNRLLFWLNRAPLDEWRRTPLIYAKKNGHEDVVRLLETYKVWHPYLWVHCVTLPGWFGKTEKGLLYPERLPFFCCHEKFCTWN